MVLASKDQRFAMAPTSPKLPVPTCLGIPPFLGDADRVASVTGQSGGQPGDGI